MNKAIEFVVVGAALTVAGLARSDELVRGRRYSWPGLPAELEAKALVGEKVSFSLMENMTTGYGWSLRGAAPKGCSAALDHRGAPVDNGLCGAPGSVVVTLSAKAAGVHSVTLDYARPWEKGTPPAETVTVRLTATNAVEKAKAQP